MMVEYPEIVVGTYEEFLLGFKLSKDENGKFKFTLDMASHAHQGSIRCLASNGEFLASSGADEYVNIYNNSSRKEVAVLTPHDGTITSLLFAPDGSHIISGSQDGAIVIIRCSDWAKLKVWNDAHKKSNGVVGMSIHPSGKLLLSIGADHILRVWNLVKGRQAYAVNFSKRITPGNSLNFVTFSSEGSHYAIAIGQTVEVYSIGSAAVIYKVECASRISCIDLSEKSILTIGREDGTIESHNIDLKEMIMENKAHDKRIKCMKFFNIGDDELYLVTADSQGIIKLWRWRRQRRVQKLTMEATIDADCRILCLTLSTPKATSQVIDSNKESSISEKTPEKKKATNKLKLGKKRNSKSPIKDSDSDEKGSSAKRRKSNSFDVVTSPKSTPLKRASISTSQWNVT